MMAKMTTFLVFPSPENIQMQHLWMDCYKFQSFSVFHLMFTIKMEGGVLKFIISYNEHHYRRYHMKQKPHYLALLCCL